jgi:hypothetical protein
MPITPRPSESKSDFTLPDEGVYTVQFVDYEGPMPSTFDRTKENIMLQFEIVDDDDFEGSKIKQYFGWSMHPTMSKLYPFICALYGKKIGDEDQVDLDELIGTRVNGTVIHIEKPDKNNPSQMVTFARLASVAPIRRKRPAAEPKPAPKPEPEYDEEQADDEEWPESA